MMSGKRNSMFSESYFIGLHWCAYIENRARGYGLKNNLDQPYEDAVKRMREFNQRVYQVAECACLKDKKVTYLSHK